MGKFCRMMMHAHIRSHRVQIAALCFNLDHLMVMRSEPTWCSSQSWPLSAAAAEPCDLCTDHRGKADNTHTHTHSLQWGWLIGGERQSHALPFLECSYILFIISIYSMLHKSMKENSHRNWDKEQPHQCGTSLGSLVLWLPTRARRSTISLVCA